MLLSLGLLAWLPPGSIAPDQPDATKEVGMGVVIAFGVPALRVRRHQTEGFCEVTVFPGRLCDRHEVLVPSGDHGKQTSSTTDRQVKRKRGK